jgi:hypothetical protein
MAKPSTESNEPLRAPFPYFGGKRDVAPIVWDRFGRPKQYLEPFCGSAAVLLAAPAPCPLEVVGDWNGFIANFWRAVVYQNDEVAKYADYPVSHVDIGARHGWLMEQRERLAAELQDPNWPGDAKVAGWWLYGQCAWIGSGWCEWDRGGAPEPALQDPAQIPRVTAAGQGIQARGRVPEHASTGRGLLAIGADGASVKARGKIPAVAGGGSGIQARGRGGKGPEGKGSVPHTGNAGRGVQAKRGAFSSSGGDIKAWTSAGYQAFFWLRRIATRLERVRVIHGSWDRCLNSSYGGDETAVFLDPPYEGYEGVYRAGVVAQAVCDWARENPKMRVAICGHAGDYDLPGWEVFLWERTRSTMGSNKTKAEEAIYFSPGCCR